MLEYEFPIYHMLLDAAGLFPTCSEDFAAATNTELHFWNCELWALLGRFTVVCQFVNQKYFSNHVT